MAVQIKYTSSIANEGVKIALTGESGSGKTFQTSMVSRPLVISSENGLLTLHGYDIPYIEVSSVEDLEAVKKEILSNKDLWEMFDTLVIDSMSDIAERCLNSMKKTVKDARQAYSAMMDKVWDILLDICSLKGKDIVCIYKLGRIQDPLSGKVSYAPEVPSDKFASKMPYLFDEVLVLRTGTDEEGGVLRKIQTINDGQYTAKDRSGCLEPYEEPDLGMIINKIKGHING